MHPYATDSNERKWKPFLLAIVSVIFAWLLNRVLNSFQFTMLWWFDAPSVIGFYGILYTLFNRYLWRVSPLKKIGLITIPNLNGIWNGYVASSFDEHAVKHDATIKICQNWTKISISLKTQNSTSNSLSATILTKDQNATVISYEYLNEPLPNAVTSMHMHRGTARLSLEPNSKSFEGEYYTGRDRQNFGVLNFRLS